jgi:hypothetical protein
VVTAHVVGIAVATVGEIAVDAGATALVAEIAVEIVVGTAAATVAAGVKHCHILPKCLHISCKILLQSGWRFHPDFFGDPYTIWNNPTHKANSLPQIGMKGSSVL